MPGVVLIVSIPDICLLLYFLYSHGYRLTRNTVYCAILSDQIVVGCPLGVPISYYKNGEQVKNQYKIVVPLFGAANAAPNKGTTLL